MKQKLTNLKNIFSDKFLMTLLFIIIILAALLFIVGEEKEEVKEEVAEEVIVEEEKEEVAEEVIVEEEKEEEPKDEYEREQKYASYVNLQELTEENCEETQEIILEIYASYVREKEVLEDEINEIKKETGIFNAKLEEIQIASSVQEEMEDYLREKLHNKEKALEKVEKLINDAGEAKDTARAACLRLS